MAEWHFTSRVATMAIVGLVALDVVLVATALRSTQASGIDARPVSTAAPSVALGTASASPSPTASPGPASVPLQTMLVALDDQRAWRVQAGSCSAGGASTATTKDGGKTWVNGSMKLQRIVRVRPQDSRIAFVIGADTSCAAELMNSGDGGSTWSAGGSMDLAWFRDPKDSQVVRSPGSGTSEPCGKTAVLDLAVLTAGSARVLCAEGVVRSTTNNGAVWTDLGKVAGAVALAVPTVSQAETYVARVGVPDCAGVQILRVRQMVATSCIETSIPKGQEPQGQIAISLVKGGGWLSVGNATMRSTDDLATWKVS